MMTLLRKHETVYCGLLVCSFLLLSGVVQAGRTEILPAADIWIYNETLESEYRVFPTGRIQLLPDSLVTAETLKWSNGAENRASHGE